MTDDTNPPKISQELLAHIDTITSKRPKTMLAHILKQGSITTKELDELYGYKHAPRAARDVEELGIPLTRTSITENGKRMTRYSLDAGAVIAGKRGGRRSFPIKFRRILLTRSKGRCEMCGGKFPENMLEIDHKVPYEVGGDPTGLNPDEYLLLCKSCNRAKSWTCEEQCENWKTSKITAICHTCMFGSPGDYEHIAMKQKRSLTLNWEGKEVQDYDLLKRNASETILNMEEFVKRILKAWLPSTPEQKDQTQ